MRGEASNAELCRREGIAESLYYAWSKEFLEAGKRRLAGDTARAANRIPDAIRERIVQLAQDEPELSPRELATRFGRPDKGMVMVCR